MDKMKLPELRAEARKRVIRGFSTMRKAELLAALKGETPPPKKAKAPAAKKPAAKKPAEKKPAAKKPAAKKPAEKKPEVKKLKQDSIDGVYFHYEMMKKLIVPNNKAVIPAGVKRRNHEVLEFMITKLDDKIDSMKERLDQNRLEKHMKEMSEDDIKKYYASFGFDVKPSTYRGVIDIKVVGPRTEEGSAAAKKQMEKYLSIQGIDLAYKVPFFSKIQIPTNI